MNNSLPRRVSKPGPIIEYLQTLAALGPQNKLRADDARQAVRDVFATPAGAKLLELLERSTTEYALDPLDDPRALAALNSQRFIALDLRRIASDELEALDRKAVPKAGRRGGIG